MVTLFSDTDRDDWISWSKCMELLVTVDGSIFSEKIMVMTGAKDTDISLLSGTVLKT